MRVLLLIALAAGTRLSTDGGHFELHWQADGGDVPWGPVTCVQTTGFVEAGAFGFSDAGVGRYIDLRICRVLDGGEHDLAPQPPPRLAAMDVARVTVAYDGGAEVIGDVSSARVLACACSSGSSCSSIVRGTWQAAPTGTTLPAGAWDGGGCVAKPCVELAGSSSWPSGCP